MELGFLSQRSSKASNINTYVGDDGLIHFTDCEGADSVLNFSKGNNYNIYESAFTFFRSGVLEVHHIIKNDKTVVGGVGNLGSISGDRMTIVCSTNGQVIAKTDGTYGYAAPNNMVIRNLNAGDTIISLTGNRDCCCIAL